MQTFGRRGHHSQAAAAGRVAISAVGASIGISLLLSVPAFAQTNSNGYTIYTQNFDGTTPTPTGTSGSNPKATVTAGQSVILNTPGSADYDDASQSANAKVVTAGTTQTVGSTTFTNVAQSGTQALNFAWQYTPTTTGPGLERYTTSGSLNVRPTVDLSSIVSFNMFVASSAPSAQVNVTLEVEENSTNYYDADTPTDAFDALPTSVSAQPDILGMRSVDNTAETDIWIVGGSGSTLSGGYPADGKPVTSGSWQTVSFILPTDPHFELLDSGGTTGFRTSGLGSIYGMDFVPVNPISGESYSVYIDDLTIGGVASLGSSAATPEPTAWALMVTGAVTGLGGVARLRKRQSTQG